jgi:hypothetical protein
MDELSPFAEAERRGDREALLSAARDLAKHWADFLMHLSPERVKYETVRSWLGIEHWDREWTNQRYSYLVTLATQEPAAYWVTRREVADLLLIRETLPDVLNDFAQEVLLGKLPPPKPNGRPASADDLKLAFLYRFTSELVSEPLIRRFRSLSTKHRETACDLMAEALAEAGWHLDPSYLNDLFKKQQYEPIRVLADRLKPRQL